MKKSLLLSIFLSLSFNATIAQGKWELKKNENGIEVYTRKAASGNLKELRVICELDATRAQLISTLKDIDNYNQWVYSNKKSVILKTEDPDKIIYYTQCHMPWPLKDRDIIVELNIDTSPDILNVVVKGLPDYIPKNDSYIRVPYSLAVWKVTDGPDNKLKVDYSFSVDPGGSVPSWLVNATLPIGPYNSFMKLREVLKRTKNTLAKAVF
jgi:hypothetical protein